MVIHLVSRFLYSDIPDMTNATKNILFPGCFIMGEGLRPWGTYRSPTGLLTIEEKEKEEDSEEKEKG